MSLDSRAFRISSLQDGEEVFFCDTYLTSRQSARRLWPVYPLRAPIGRLLSGRYWFSSLNTLDSPLDFLAPTSTHAFCEVALTRGESYAVELSSLVAWVAPRREERAKPPFESYVRGLLRPGCWSWGHPVPTVFHGPMRLVLCADRLQQAQPDRSYQPMQLVAFNTTADVQIAHSEAKTPASVVLNAATFSNTVVLRGEGTNVYIRDFGSRKQASKRLAGRFLMLLAWTLWLSAFIVWLSNEQGWF